MTAENQDIRIEIVHVRVSASKNDGIGIRIETRLINHFMGEKKPAVILIPILVTNCATGVSLKRLTASFNLGLKDRIPILKRSHRVTRTTRRSRWTMDSGLERRINVFFQFRQMMVDYILEVSKKPILKLNVLSEPFMQIRRVQPPFEPDQEMAMKVSPFCEFGGSIERSHTPEDATIVISLTPHKIPPE